MKIHDTLFCWLICLLAQHHTFFCYNFSLHEERYQFPTKESIISALRGCCGLGPLLYMGQSLVHWLAGGRMCSLQDLQADVCSLSRAVCSAAICSLISHFRQLCHCVFCQVDTLSFSTQCSKTTTSPRHCRDRCMIIKYKSGGPGRTSTEK